MAEAVYVLCALTSIGCAVLLLRAHRGSRAPFLLWCGLCFVFLGLNNILLFVDVVLFPEVDMRLLRHAAALTGLSLLVYGLVWKTE